MTLRFDHIAVVAPSLDEGCAHVRDCLGIEMPGGGAHPFMGTHNRLMALGPESYLEVIAIDPDAPAPARPRWFDLDRFDGAPCIGTWVLGVPDLDAALSAAPAASGAAIPMTRGALSWRISVADDGALPMDGAFPTLIEWPVGPHPAGGMVDLGCRLTRLTVAHPEAAQIDAYVGGRLETQRFNIEPGPARRITAEFETPSGHCVLS